MTYKRYMTVPGKRTFDDILALINERGEKIISIIAYEVGSIFVVEF